MLRNLEPFVRKSLIQLYAKITKLGWLDACNGSWVFRNVIEEIDKFLKAGLEKCIIGVQLLELLIVEIDKAGYADNARPLTKEGDHNDFDYDFVHVYVQHHVHTVLIPHPKVK